jgi:hypothetical protein
MNGVCRLTELRGYECVALISLLYRLKRLKWEENWKAWSVLECVLYNFWISDKMLLQLPYLDSFIFRLYKSYGRKDFF